MKKIFGGIIAALALAVVTIAPKVMATNEAHLSGDSRKSIRIVHKVTHYSGETHAGFSYSLTPNPNNPAQIGGNTQSISCSGKLRANERREATIECSISLTDLIFYKVGDYAMTLVETGSSDEVNFPIDSNRYDILFQVTNQLDGEGRPTGALNVHLADVIYDYKTDSKVEPTALFETEANYTYITLTNEVRGAGADANKYFKYTISFDGINDGEILTITGQDDVVEYDGEQIVAENSFTTGGTLRVYLKHGQTVAIGDYVNGEITAHEIPQGTRYVIAREDGDDGYDTQIDDNERLSTTKEVTGISDAGFAVRNTTTAINSKDANVDTGAFVEAWPYLVVALFGVSGYIISRHIFRRA